jgi:2-aminoadipate transaminase
METPAMTSAPFDFAPLLPAGLPAPAAKWTGLAKYSFVGGNNDPDQVPVEGLIDAVDAVLRREGRTLATYGLASGPQGYRPLREFLTAKLKRDAGIDCAADDILIVSGSLQALDLVNATLLSRGDTVIIERDTYQGALNRLTRLGVNVVGIPWIRTACGWTRWPRRSPTSRAAASRRNTSTPSRPCRTRPAPSCPRPAAPSF